MKIFSKTKRLYYLLLFAITILFMISFPEAGLSGTLFQNQSISHDGIVRTYHLYVPDDLPGSSVPLLFILHGGTSNADEIIGLPGNAAPFKIFFELADIDKFIAVIPNGVADTDPESRQWNDCRGDCTGNGNADDVGFIEALITNVQNNHPAVDLNRVYCTGISNGGQMCLRLAYELSDKIAAIAMISAANAAVNDCQPPNNPIPIMMINGTDDPILPWDGGQVAAGLEDDQGTTISVMDTIAFWTTHNSTEEINITDIPNIDTFDKSTVSKETYGNGEEGTEVILYRVNGGGHPIPSIQERYSWLYQRLLVGWQNHDIETAVEAWAFLQKHELNGPVGCDEPEICDGVDNDCDGEIDEGFVFSTYYRDADGDSYGDTNNSTDACLQPEGYVTDNTDCDDANSGVYIGATETCDGVDNNCDGQIDEGYSFSPYYRDADGDSYGDLNNSTDACLQPEGFVSNSDDCDDANSGVYIGATETCDGVDNNCDGNIDEGCPLCQPKGATCSSDSECCTGKCRGNACR